MSNGYIKGNPDVSFWLQQIRKGIEYRKKYAREDEWERWRKYYRCQWAKGTMPTALYFKLLRTIIPRVYFRNPSISIVSAKPGPANLAFAHILERVDNRLIRSMKMKQQMKRIVQNAFMFGTGVGKLGYGAEFSLITDAVSTAAPMSAKGERVEYNELIMPDMPWFMNVHPGKFIVPSGLEFYEDTRWSAMWIRRPLDDVQSDPRFKNVKDLKPSTGNLGDMTQDLGKTGIKRALDEVDLIEVRDKKFGKVFVLAPFMSNKVLFYEDDDLNVNGRHTFYTLRFNEDDEVFWGIPDSVVIDPLQREGNEIKTQIMRHRRLSLVKLLYLKDMIEEDQLEKLVSEDVMPAVAVKDFPDKVVKLMETGGIPRDLMIAAQDILQEARETVGFGRNQFGEFREGSEAATAFEAQVVAAASEIRVDERRDMVADMLVDIVTDMHEIVFERWGSEQVIDVAGPNGVQLWVQFRGSMLKGGAYELSIDPDSSVPETKQVREAKAVRLYELLQQNPMISPTELTRYLLREMNNISMTTLMQGIPEGVGLDPMRPMQPDQYGLMLQNMMGAARAQGGA